VVISCGKCTASRPEGSGCRKKGEEKLEKRTRKRALLIIWRLHVSQFYINKGI